MYSASSLWKDFLSLSTMKDNASFFVSKILSVQPSISISHKLSSEIKNSKSGWSSRLSKTVTYSINTLDDLTKNLSIIVNKNKKALGWL